MSIKMKIMKKIYTISKRNEILCSIARLVRHIMNVICFGAAWPLQYFVEHSKRIAYLPIAKVGTSSIKASIYKMTVQDYNIIHGELEFVEDISLKLPIWVKAHDKNKYNEYYKFTFVRNPFNRLVSCYENKYHSDKKRIGVSMKFLYFQTYLLGYLKEDNGFKEFVKKMAKIPLKFADPHFIPQSYYILDKNGACRVDYVGKFENFEHDWAWLMEKYSFAPLSHYNKTDKVNWMDYYDRKTAELVYMYYEKDIKSFGYEESYKELIEYIEKKERVLEA